MSEEVAILIFAVGMLVGSLFGWFIGYDDGHDRGFDTGFLFGKAYTLRRITMLRCARAVMPSERANVKAWNRRAEQ